MRRAALPALRRLLAAAWLSCAACAVNAEMVVVMSAKSPIASLSRDEVVNIFMGRYRKLPDGTPAIPIDGPPDSDERRAFYRQLLDRSPEEINVYWARLVFAGRTKPPLEAPGIKAMQSEVAEHPQMVGYLDRKQLTSQLKVVYSLSE